MAGLGKTLEAMDQEVCHLGQQANPPPTAWLNAERRIPAEIMQFECDPLQVGISPSVSSLGESDEWR